MRAGQWNKVLAGAGAAFVAIAVIGGSAGSTQETICVGSNFDCIAIHDGPGAEGWTTLGVVGMFVLLGSLVWGVLILATRQGETKLVGEGKLLTSTWEVDGLKRAARIRDNQGCQRCGTNIGIDVYWINTPTTRHEITVDNLVTRCPKCLTAAR